MTTTDARHETVLVLGGNGKTGRRVAAGLREHGLRVRIGSRAGEPPFLWEDRGTWPKVLDGVRAAYIAYSPDLAAPEGADDVGAFAALAVELGVRRLVLLSGRGEPGALRGERAVQDSGADWTIVRSSWFAQNFSEDYLLEPVLAGEIALPAGEVGEPFVDAEDVADVAVAALTAPGHEGKVYEVTGPRLLTFGEATAEIARATGRDIRYTHLPAAEYAALLGSHGLPAELVSLLTDLFTEVLDGRNAHTADGVRQALGRPPRDFTEYALRAASEGAWTRG
ncbi:NmrA family transcriptional regulator [Streptomyces sp. NPDC088197]|uniref:NmrA family transcriptional regulator n=1 Tax=unclassified Streptomyces TaxID=2593676 RepID=UPI0033B6F9B6